MDFDGLGVDGFCSNFAGSPSGIVPSGGRVSGVPHAGVCVFIQRRCS